MPDSLFLGILLSVSVGMTVGLDEDSEWRRDTEAWRAAREQKLRSPDGWLSVSGLFYLTSGEQTFGSGKSCQILLTPTSSPEIAGTLTVSDLGVYFRAANGVNLKWNDNPAKSGLLDIAPILPEADSPDRLTVGTTTLHLIRRSGRLAIRLKDSANPLITSFPGERWYPPNKDFRVTGRFTPYTEEKKVLIENIKGETHEETLAGSVEFKLQGNSIRLDAIADTPETLFIIFRDRTSGQQTYGAGRFLSVSKPVDGDVLLDFNRAYNPPCAYNPFTLCPLPPKQNHPPHGRRRALWTRFGRDAGSNGGHAHPGRPRRGEAASRGGRRNREGPSGLR